MRFVLANSGRSLWRMILPPTLWAVHFVTIYGMTAVLCAKGADPATARLGVAIASGVALAALGSLALSAWRQWDFPEGRDAIHGGSGAEDRREFLGHLAFLLAVISAIGVLFASLPAVWIVSCR